MRLGEDRAGTSALVLRLSGSVNVNTIHNTIAYFMTQEEELTWLIFLMKQARDHSLFRRNIKGP